MDLLKIGRFLAGISLNSLAHGENVVVAIKTGVKITQVARIAHSSLHCFQADVAVIHLGAILCQGVTFVARMRHEGVIVDR